MASWDATQAEATTRQSTQVDSTGYVRLLWESNEEDDELTHAAIFEVKFGKRQKKHSLIRASEQLIRFFLTSGRLHWPLMAATSASPRTISCLRQDVFKTPKKATVDHIKS